jgi:hypothetical protein
MCRIQQDNNKFRLLVAISCLNECGKYGRFSVCCLNPVLSVLLREGGQKPKSGASYVSKGNKL